MFDFQELHASQLATYREHASRLERIVRQGRRAEARLTGIAAVASEVARQVLQRRALLPKELIGRKVDLLV